MLEPRSGRFWRELSPGDDVQAAVKACPEGGCILLRPGTFDLAPLRDGLSIYAVNVFGRGHVTLVAPLGCSRAVAMGGGLWRRTFALDGVTVRSRVGGECGVRMRDGLARLQSCFITGRSVNGVEICDSLDSVGEDDDEDDDVPHSDAVVINCRCEC